MTARIVLLVILLNGILVFHSRAGTGLVFNGDSISTAGITKAKSMLMRLDIINATDQSEYSRTEKRTIRKEVRAIKANLKELRGGRYTRTTLIVIPLAVPVSVFYLTE